MAGIRTASAVPILRIDTTHKMFDSTKVRIGRTAYDSIFVQNIGSTALTIDSVRITGVSAGLYTVVSKPDTAIAGGGFGYVVVSFSPVSIGVFRDSMTIFSNGGTAGRSLTGIGVSPSISLSTAVVNFDSVRIGDQTCRPVTITNPGSDSLAITSNTLTSPDGAFYYLALSGHDTLIPPGRSANIGVCFVPIREGRDTAIIAVKPDIPGDTNTRYIVVIGTGVHVSTLTASPITTTTAIVGLSTCTTDTLRVSGGTNTVTITSLKVVGADSSAVTLTRPSLPDTLRLDSSFVYTLCVNPTHRGPLQASIEVGFTSLGLRQTVTVPLSITGQQVCASASPTTIFQNPTLVGRTDTARITVTNCGDIPTSYSLTLPLGATAYRIFGNSTSSTIAPGSSATFTVLYSPTTVIPDTGTLVITGGTGVTPIPIVLGGTGGTVTITSFDTVPDVMVGSCQDFPITLHNSGTIAWTSGLAQIIGPNAGDFTIKNATTVTIAPDSTATIIITFCPKSVATETATLTFPGASPNMVTQITLNGRGIVSGVAENGTNGLTLSGVYPNPSATKAKLSYYLPTAADVRVELVDARGALLQILEIGHANDGNHDITVSTKSLPNGTYFILLTADGIQLSKQFTVVH
jgi:hypothetical protein